MYGGLGSLETAANITCSGGMQIRAEATLSDNKAH